MDEIPRWADAFVTALEKLHKSDDRAALARLKRCAGHALGEDPEVLALFYRLASRAGVPSGREDDSFLAATLFPFAPERWHPDPQPADEARASVRRPRTDFGRSLRRLAGAEGVNEAGLDRRLTVLLDADRSELPFRLRQAVRMVAQKDVPVDWRQLLLDLQRWEYLSRTVQKRWASSYFRIHGGDPAGDDPTPGDGDQAEESDDVD